MFKQQQKSDSFDGRQTFLQIILGEEGVSKHFGPVVTIPIARVPDFILSTVPYGDLCFTNIQTRKIGGGSVLLKPRSSLHKSCFVNCNVAAIKYDVP